MSGMHRITGAPLDAWDHVRQSIQDLLTTPIGSRVMRRDYGADIPSLIDRPGTPEVVIEVGLAIAAALERWEPRFALKAVSMNESTGTETAGAFLISVVGTYYPRGHQGDFSIQEDEKGLEVWLS